MTDARITALANVDWTYWESTIARQGITLDRPRGSTHPAHSDIRYPIDYGYVNGTRGEDGEEVDVFVGAQSSGLVAAIVTRDFRKGDVELKLLYGCGPAEVYLVHGFLNFDRRLMEGTLVMREPMRTLWERCGGP